MDQKRDHLRGASWATPFFTLWTGQAFSLLGSQLVQFALIWWLTQMTGSATVLATASLVGLLPPVFLGPVAGALIDRWNRRITMLVSDGLVALATLVLAVLFASGAIQVWHVYLLLLVRAAAGSFHWPAMAASTSLMVPQAHLSRVQGFNQMLNGGLNIASAPLGALLLGVLPMQGVLFIDIGTAILAIVVLLFIPVPQPSPQPRDETGLLGAAQVWADLKGGLRYVAGWPGLLMIMLLATVVNLLLNPAFALLPLLVKDHFGGGALQLGWAESSWGVGIVLGGLALSTWGGFRRRILTVLFGLAGLGIGVILVGLIPAERFPLALGAMLLAGVMIPMVDGPLFAILQTHVAPEVQGRVFTLLHSAAKAASPLGLALAGPLADVLGVRAWFLLGGAATSLAGLAGFLIPAVLRIEKDEPLAPVGMLSTPSQGSRAEGGTQIYHPVE